LPRGVVSLNLAKIRPGFEERSAYRTRRTFFSYFKSEDDIILFWQDADSARLIADLLKTSPDVPPLDAVRDVMVKHIARYTTEQMTAVDNLMRSSASLLARKQAYYAEQEQALFNTLCEVWRQPERRLALRMVAVVSVGAMRLALQAWRDQAGQRSLRHSTQSPGSLTIRRCPGQSTIRSVRLKAAIFSNLGKQLDSGHARDSRNSMPTVTNGLNSRTFASTLRT
jgi:AcrR family transcriptional regulator